MPGRHSRTYAQPSLVLLYLRFRAAAGSAGIGGRGRLGIAASQVQHCVGAGPDTKCTAGLIPGPGPGDWERWRGYQGPGVAPGYVSLSHQYRPAGPGLSLGSAAARS